ncbi:Peroxiredoxin [Corynebacterium mustelae]|uniref:Peroxiredoxin n=1 Tax=Corynebacterium mustelae TaxID=571915 RepID=A0A0G3GU94_9CORY|nr:TlpA disulfide reductase family protein [Corynebacterium mustelae]AKK04694.1 Peroxiredoxin [Corynebacterium mustelae]
MAFRRPQRAALMATLLVTAALTGCSADDTAGKNAVAVGGTFQFHSPGGETVITYPESERGVIGDFSGPSLASDTEIISLADYDGKIVVLNAWGQWCGPCRTEVDDLQEVHEYLEKTGGSVIGINVRDTKAIAHDFMVDNGLTYPSIYDPPFKLAAQLGGLPAAVIPTTVVLDTQHRPAAVFLKEVTAAELLETIKTIETN